MFRAFNLLAPLTARENITLPADLAGRHVDRHWFDTVVRALDVADRLGHRPAQLWGGQQQRVAIAPALVERPEVVFADEPTGALDSRASAELLTFLCNAVGFLLLSIETIVRFRGRRGAGSLDTRSPLPAL